MQDKFQVLVNAVIFKQGKVLLAKRTKSEAHAAGKWTVPGGKIEALGEIVFDVIQATLTREVKEETNVEVESDYCIVKNNVFATDDGRSVLSLVFACDWVSGAAKPQDETEAVEWVSIEQLDEFELAPNVKEYILAAWEYVEIWIEDPIDPPPEALRDLN